MAPAHETTGTVLSNRDGSKKRLDFAAGNEFADALDLPFQLHAGMFEDALALTNQEVVDALGGLPAHKLHCSVLAEEAVKSAIQDYYDKNHSAYDHSKFPKKEDCESCCRMV